MSEMPEKLLIDRYRLTCLQQADDDLFDCPDEYIRADLYATIEAENAALKAKADKLAEVLEEWLAMQPTTLL